MGRSAFLVGLLTAVAATGLLGVLGASAAPAHRAYYKPCGTFEYRGKHELFKHAYSCDKAKKKAKYVLKHKRAPKGWKCSLNELPNGFAACQNGKKAFSFVPFNG